MKSSIRDSDWYQLSQLTATPVTVLRSHFAFQLAALETMGYQVTYGKPNPPNDERLVRVIEGVLDEIANQRYAGEQVDTRTEAERVLAALRSVGAR